MNDIYSISLLDILPESLKSDPQVQALAQAITPELQSISADIVQCILLPNIDQLPEEVVDLLAFQMHCDFYESDLPPETKRALVKGSVVWHRHKGTPWAVEQMVSVVFQDAQVQEWFDYGGQPYHFKISTNQTLVAQADLNRLLSAINATKNARSWLEEIVIKRTINAGLFLGCLISEGKATEITPIAFIMPNLTIAIYEGGFITATQTVTVTPKPFQMQDLSQNIYSGGIIRSWCTCVIS